jgi:hypothetical protein
MPQHIYLDTNAFRYFGEAFAEDTLADDLRNNMLISPLSAFEVLAQLAREDCGDDVLHQISAIRNWTNPAHSGLLPWPDAWLYQVWFQKPKSDEGFTKRMESAFNWCLTATSEASLTALKEVSADHSQLMDDFKYSKAQEFKAMIEAAKQEKVQAFDATEVWFVSIANSIGADPKSKPVAEIVNALSAYHEFGQAKLETALTNPEYNPLNRKNQNDIIDAEQLVYLADPSLCLLTSDGGFKSKVTKSAQATRIITVPPDKLMDAKRAEAVLRAILVC